MSTVNSRMYVIIVNPNKKDQQCYCKITITNFEMSQNRTLHGISSYRFFFYFNFTQRFSFWYTK